MSSISLTNLNSPTTYIDRVGPPDEGKQGWLKVLGCFFIYNSTYGLAATYGAYQAYYQTDMLTSHSPSSISWIGTVQVFLLGFLGLVSGPLYDMGYARSLVGVGCFLVVFGTLMLSFAKSYYQILLSQGICIGLGNGLIYVPSVSAVANAFTTNRPIATGVSATGAAVGGVLFPIMFRNLVPTIGFGWVNRIFAAILFIISIPAFIFLGSDNMAAHRVRRQQFWDPTAFKEPAFLLLALGMFFVELGYWIPPFTIAPYAQLYLKTSADFAFYLLAIISAGSFVGRTIPSLVAQVRVIGPAWVLVSGVFRLGVLVLSWIGIRNVAGLAVWSVLLGFMSGIAVSLPNAVLPRLSPWSVVGARSGMMWSFVSFAALFGTPIASSLVDPETSNYKNGQLFSGLSMLLGAGLLCVPAVYTHRKRND